MKSTNRWLVVVVLNVGDSSISNDWDGTLSATEKANKFYDDVICKMRVEKAAIYEEE